MKFLTFLMPLLVLFHVSCSQGASEKSDENQQAHSKTHAHKQDDNHKASNKDLIPDNRFNAYLLSGEEFDSVDHRGERLLLGFFSYTHRDAKDLLLGLQALADQQAQNNFKIVLVNLNSGKETEVQGFLKGIGVSLPTIVGKKSFEIAQMFQVSSEVSLIGLDVDHNPYFGFKRFIFGGKAFGTPEEAREMFLDYLRENLNIKVFHETMPYLGIYPDAPDFTAPLIGQAGSFKLSQLKGKKAVLLIFFSPKCPHCQREMKFLRDKIYPEYQNKGFEVLAVSVLRFTPDVKKVYDSFNFKWPVIEDARGQIRRDIF